MLAIKAARLFNGVDATPLPQPVVLVDAGKVVGVQSGDDAPADAQVVDLGDVTLMPGLIDGHIHLAFDASADPVGWLATASDDEVLDGMRAAARRTLMAGITTVRDLGDRGYLGVRLREELANAPAVGSQVLTSGPPLTVHKGHCWYLGGEAEGVEGVRAAVRERAERGVDVIKVMATGGELTPGTVPFLPSYSLEELRAAAEEAHRLGLPITAHAHGTAGIANVAAAGFDMVEHCTFMTADGAEVDETVLDAIKKSGLVVSATLGALPGFPRPPRIEAILPKLVVVFTRLREAGLTIVCSSDAGIAPPKPHDCLPWAVSMMVELNGYDTATALRACTSVSAAALGLGRSKGRVAPGFDADLLAVNGNPLTDVAALRDVAAVFRAGVRVR